MSVRQCRAAAMAGSNGTRGIDALLASTDGKPASFSVHLYPEHWVLNNGSKFLYQHQTAVRLFLCVGDVSSLASTVHPR
jgi:hypothetical protein